MSDEMIAIIDYSTGNVRSVQKAFEKVGFKAVITRDHELIRNAQKIVLPGVGAFGDGMKNLHEFGLVDLLKEEVLVRKKPFLGICLGMQLIAATGYEKGKNAGLGWIDAEVVRFDFTALDRKLKIPHVGWNNVQFANKSSLFDGVADQSDFYFVHSFHFKTSENVATSMTDYGYEFISSINKENIYAAQFHPEKSQTLGLKMISNFAQL